MSDVSTMEPVEKWRFQGRKVPVIKGHVRAKERRENGSARGEEEASSFDWDKWSDDGASSQGLLSATSFANKDDWQLEPFLEDELTGRR